MMNFDRILKLYTSKAGKLCTSLKLTQTAKNELDNLKGEFETRSEALWAAINKHNKRPTCQTCNNRVNFISLSSGFYSTCSVKCAANNLDVKAKIAKTQHTKYGGHHTRTKEYKDNIIQKYGEIPGSYGTQSFKSAMLNKYGVNNFFERADLMKLKYQAKYGVDNPMQDNEVKSKANAAYKEKHGGIGYAAPHVMAQLKNIVKAKYGVENISQCAEIRERIKATCRVKYGGNSPMASPTIKRKVAESGNKLREFIFPSGNIVEVMGYEPLALAYLLLVGYNEAQLLVDLDVPTVALASSAYHTYTADIYIPDDNLLIDVKSKWTYALAQTNHKGMRAAKAAGYNFCYLIMDESIAPIWVWDEK